MRINWKRAYRLSLMLSSGAVTCGFSAALANVNWGSVVSGIITYILQAFVSFLLGGSSVTSANGGAAGLLSTLSSLFA